MRIYEIAVSVMQCYSVPVIVSLTYIVYNADEKVKKNGGIVITPSFLRLRRYEPIIKRKAPTKNVSAFFN